MRLKLFPLVCLAALAALVTGCPHGEYTVELAPRGKLLERTLTFYCRDGTNFPALPNLSTNELAELKRAYPTGSLQQLADRYVVSGQFSGGLPRDVGGTASYTLLSTSLGEAAFYVERFRGNPDLAAEVMRRLAAADKLADHFLGWSRMQFGAQEHYEELRRFLDVDFRQDLRNLALYVWNAQAKETSAEALEGFRFTGEPATNTNKSPADFPRDLLKNALKPD